MTPWDELKDWQKAMRVGCFGCMGTFAASLLLILLVLVLAWATQC